MLVRRSNHSQQPIVHKCLFLKEEEEEEEEEEEAEIKLCVIKWGRIYF